MHTYIKTVTIFIIIICISLVAKASHLAGFDFTYSYAGDSAGLHHYRVTLTLFDDCFNGDPVAIAQDNPVFFGLFDPVTEEMLSLDSSIYYSSSTVLPVTAYGICDSGATDSEVCMLKKNFVKDYYLSSSTHGYTIAYQRCCLNGALVNIIDPATHGITATCTIPPDDIPDSTNNSALFKNFPPLIIPLGQPLVYDCSATDVDGDSLSYDICKSYTGANDAINAKPYPLPPFNVPYSFVYPLTADSPMTCSTEMILDNATGQLTATPNALGRYLISVCCNEWRRGQLVNTVHREFEFTVINCHSLLTSLPSADTLSLYPNPSSSTVSVACSHNITTIIVSDIMGKLFTVPISFPGVFGGGTNKKEADLDISALPIGIYMVKINGSIVRRFEKF